METKHDILDNLNLRSEQVQEVLESPPHWLIRWGSLVFVILILLIFFLSSIIKYPEFVQSAILITSKNPPEKLEARLDAKIERVLVKDHNQVKKGDVLIVFQSTANYQDVLQLKSLIDSFSNKSLKKFPLKKTSGFKLGDIQEDYNAFAKTLEDEKLFNNLEPYAAETITAERNIADYQSRISNLRQQSELESSKLDLITKNYKRSEFLQSKGVISLQELESEKLKLLEAQKNVKNATISLSQLNEAILGFKKMKTGADINTIKDKITFSNTGLQLLERLRKSVRQWEQSYLIVSSTTGTVSFLGFLGENQFVKTGSPILSILPKERLNIIGQMHIAAQNQGKVQLGQKVLIKLDNFRYQEFGMVKGNVKTISLTPDKDGKYYVEIAMPKGLLTTYHKTLTFDNELSGNADIVTEELTLSQRILNQFRALLRFQNS